MDDWAKLLFDSNIIIYHFGGDDKANQMIAKYTPIISVITEIEVLWRNQNSKEDIELMRELFVCIDSMPLTNQIKKQATYMRIVYWLKTPDAIIAATAIQHKLPLITADKTLRKIKETEIIPFKIT